MPAGRHTKGSDDLTTQTESFVRTSKGLLGKIIARSGPTDVTFMHDMHRNYADGGMEACHGCGKGGATPATTVNLWSPTK
jgi:hypothetical protein